jgi:hypothetical protein
MQSERFVRHLAFMIDLHEELQAVSICFQADSVTVADVAQRVGFAINAIKKQATICGDIESAVHRYITTGKGHGSKAAFKSSAAVPRNTASTIKTVRVFATILQGASISATSLLFPTPLRALRVLVTSTWPV